MPKVHAASHAAHDELLIARLYGDDVDDRERVLALDLLAGCDECAALYADLGSIAKATTDLPVQTRSRDFSLTLEDAVRLRPHRRGGPRLPAFGRRRSFGGALVALGISGLVLTSAVSMLGTVATSPTLTSAERNAAPQAVDAASPDSYSQGGVALASSGATAAPAPTEAPDKVAGTAGPAAISSPADASPPTLGPVASNALDQSAPSGGPAVAGGVNSTQSTPGEPPGETLTSTASQPGPDGRLLVLAGSAVVITLGLAVLLLPAVRRRLTRR